MKGLTIYKSSAGSGKTYTLVREYLRIVLERPTDYRHTLAITFTNKATQEMKSRIVSALADLAEGKINSLKEDLEKALPHINIQSNSQLALDYILHDYSRFSISTIDSFFQRIIRSLAREMHLPIRFDVEMDQENVVDAITENLLEEAGNDADLTRWMQDLVLMKMEDDKGWKVEDDIRSVANELFTETFPEHTLTISRETLRSAITEMRTIQRSFIHEMQQYGREALKTVEDNGLTEADFYYGSKGVIGYFKKLVKADYKSPDIYIPNSYVQSVYSGAKEWASPKTADKGVVDSIVSAHLSPILNNCMTLYEDRFKPFVTAQEALKFIYISGIISDLSKKLGDYRDENNLVFISDAPKILSSFITSEDTPLVYEKVGTTFKHFLIDEFQDTSSLQWKNILPLIREGLGSGHSALIVGDVKQSIYRWRGGNMQLLNGIKNDLPEFRQIIKEEKLSTNYRSRKLIVDFNNEFFTNAAQLVNAQLQLTDKDISTIAYDSAELNQAVTSHLEEGGFLCVKFYDSEKKSGEGEEGLKWKEKAAKELVKTIQGLLEKGFEPKDIAILVRKNLHGNEIATHLFENGIEKVISPDSLLLDSSIKINFLLSTLRFLADQSNHIARTEVIYGYSRYQLNKETKHELFAGSSNLHKSKSPNDQPTLFNTDSLKDNTFNRILPERFTQHLFYLSKLPLYELVEQLISIFNLNNQPDAYLQRFQDVVLEQTIKQNISLSTFIEWWENNCNKFSVIVPENENAITIMTIHKSKGLQFPIVLIPWMEWTLGPNQRDLLWVTSEESPYYALGTIPVKPTKALLNTSFKGQYEDELISNYIDNLNLMYVAMTRAEEQLYIFSENSGGGEIKNVSNIVKSAVAKSSVIKSDASSSEAGSDNSLPEETYQAGELKVLARKKQEDQTTVIDNYLINRWQEKISISSKAKDLQQMMNSGLKQKVDFGILVHRVLSEIAGREEINSALEKLLFEGVISKKEAEQLKGEIQNYFSIEGVDLFYNKEWKAMIEKEIILPGGEILRPDRVLIRDKEAMVIDFKTGRQESSHAKQVKKYAATLKTMGYKEAKPFLIYINEGRIAAVD